MSEKYVPNPVEIKPGFFVVETTNWRPVSRDGRVIDSHGNETYGYESLGLYRYVSKQAVHRLVALTFLSCPGDPKRFMVNHKDGNPSNNHVDNLEWCTFEYNSKHAHEMGLYKRGKVFLKDLETGEITEYPTSRAVADFLNISGSVVAEFLKGRRRIPLKRKYDLRREDEPWSKLTKNDVNHNTQMGREVYIQLEDGTEIVCGNKNIASKVMNIGHNLIWKLCSRERRYETGIYNGVKYSFLDTFDEKTREKIRENAVIHKCEHVYKKPKEAVNKPKRIIVTNLETKEQQIWNSLREFAESQNVKYLTLISKLSSGNRIWRNFHVKKIN